MFVPVPPRKPADIPPAAARVLLAAAVPLLVAALTLALFRNHDAVAGPASWLVIVMIGLVVAWLAVAAFGGRARE